DGDDAVSGTFRWDKGRNVIALDAENFPPYYRVGEDRLIQMDMEGNPITGDLADNYVLTFRSASLAGQQDAGTLAPLPCPVIPPKDEVSKDGGSKDEISLMEIPSRSPVWRNGAWASRPREA
ncbi:MAG: copper resistance protein NlpE, partial [Candidatus Accumulibacter sp.]|nr:copper resistance protein NlpE [Accumulibacter sp.]